MIHMKYTKILILYTFFLIGLGETACDTGWFGTNCEYKCHCAPNTATCDINGKCSAGKCASGWFGPACQYQDLFSQPQVATSSLTATILADRDDNTCLTTNTGNLTVTLNMIYPINWIRLVVKKPDQLHNITISFHDTQNSVTTCGRTVIQDRTMDIICEVIMTINKMSIIGDGVNSLCSLYISGGRNVAVKQMTSQSSIYSESGIIRYSSLAVDGNSDSDFSIGSCSHTSPDEAASNWNVTFSRPQLVNRYILYNRRDFQERLLNFSLSSLNPDKGVVFTYSIPPKVQLIYAVTSSPELVSFVKIFTNVTQILTLCEVEIYGDSVCSTNRFGLDCDKSCNCENKTETCFVATGGCPSGCAAGFYGDGCQNECLELTWGSGCLNNCSSHCVNKTCDKRDGTCDNGCEAGYFMHTCNQTCPSATWGKGCQNDCSDHCLDNPCNVTNGRCDSGCEPGYLGDNCIVQCPKLTWGSQCLKRCSEHCLNKTCDFVNGIKICDFGCDASYNDKLCLDATSLSDYTTGYNNGLGSGIGIGIGVTIAAVVIICIALYIWFKRRQRASSKPRDTTDRHYDHVDPTQSRDTTDRHYDHIDPIQQNEHAYNTADKTGNEYDIVKDVMIFNAKTNSVTRNKAE
ncbi:unnamed protein product [Lymnaea stagnalis]|uniref:Fucolectin tachylectin-4 pentraxin-1 domain-containing protein n=1 Tax=Lymnaea stagnalis TaxID=6523 RepID=A0AAV2HE37_LYMST